MISALVALLLFAATGLSGGPAFASTQPQPQWRGVDAVPGLQEEIELYASELAGRYGVAMVDLEDGGSAFVNSGESFPMASMYKLLVMYRVYEAMDSGYLAWDDVLVITAGDTAESDPADGDFLPGERVTVGQALVDMITVSRNASAYALTRAVGGWNAVASAAGELGMASTYFDGEFWSTPEDVSRFFLLLGRHELVSLPASYDIIELLLLQTKNDRIPALLPEDVYVAHKTGELPGVRNDGGIVYPERGRYILVIMSEGGDPWEQTQAAAEISRMVLEHRAGSPAGGATAAPEDTPVILAPPSVGAGLRPAPMGIRP